MSEGRATILWRYSPSGDDHQVGRFCLHTNVYIYIHLKRTPKGWKWTVDANNGRHLASSGVYFVERSTAEADVTTWANNYRRDVG